MVEDGTWTDGAAADLLRLAAAVRLTGLASRLQVSLQRNARYALSRWVPARTAQRGTPTNNKALARRASLFVGSLTMTYFRAVYPALSSALRRFTVLFGMGRRGANALWSSEKTVARQTASVCPAACFTLNNAGRSKDLGFDHGLPSTCEAPQRACGYRIKPHGQLVRLSLTCYHASTRRLSTSWSRTTL